MNYIPRHIAPVIEETSKTFPVTLLTGSRQVGKTTLLKKLFPKVTYETLDKINVLDAAKHQPELFLKGLKKPAVIDEVQYAPELFRYIKILVDSDPDEKCQLFLTGSQRFQMMKGVDESLAGRAAIIEMLGLSMREIKSDSFRNPFVPTDEYIKDRRPKQKKTFHLWDSIFKGDLPELYKTPSINIVRYYDSYIETYLRRDVRDLANVGDLAKFNRFLVLLAHYHGKMINKSDLADRLDASFQTIEKWLSILEASNVIYMLRPFAANTAKRLTKTPKLYFLNSGIPARLHDFESSADLENSAESGAFFEGYVIAEIIKSYLNYTGIMPTMYFYRDSNGNEIDLVIEKGTKLYPIEIKKAEIVKEHDAKAFKDLDEIKGYERQSGAVICQADSPLPLTDKVWTLPVEYI